MAKIRVSIIVSIPHCHTDKVWAVKMVNIGISIIISNQHCPIDYFSPFCCLDYIFTARILSIGQCGILTMIDTQILAILMRKKSLKILTRLHVARALSEGQCGLLTMIDISSFAILYEKKVFENLETSRYSPGFVSRAMWNTNDDRYSNFGYLYEKQ